MFQRIKNLFKNNTHENIYALLLKLGSTKEEVRDYLLANNHKGRRMKPRACPIAQYLISNGIDINQGGVIGQYNSIEISSQTFNVNGVAEFILYFDNGAYPELEEND